jgi:hypothetical protein
MANIVYVFTNEAMPGLAKIGITDDSVESRLGQLSAHSGVPLPFECYFAAEVPDAARTEQVLHQLFSEYRVNPKREFFRLDPEKVVLALSLGEFTEITLGQPDVDVEEKEALERAKSRRPRLSLAAIDIKPGDILQFSRDENVTARVTDGDKVDFEGQVMSLSASALICLQRMGYKTQAASGSGYWKFDGELLDERRRRIEAERSSPTEEDR